MIMRRRPLLRAAAVGGGAYLAGKNVARRQTEQQYLDADRDARIADLERQQAPAQQPPVQQAPGTAGPSLVEQLNQLTELHRRGDLTDEEFAAAKAGLLAS